MTNIINKPKMIIFDYGQTLVNEKKFDAIKGNKAVLQRVTKNSYNTTAEEIQDLAIKMSKEIGKAFGEENRNKQLLEIPALTYDRYLYEYFDLEFDTDLDEIQYVFWTNAISDTCETTEEIEELLEYLWENGIRTAVVSNMMNSSKNLERWINKMIPNNHFEFFIASSDYVFRKPHPFIFEMAMRKANLQAEDIWFCGDNLLCDIEGAYNIGMTPVFYPKYIDRVYGVDTDVPYTKINTWSEMIAIIETLRNSL